MRILANENFPGKAVEVLRLHGHDVIWIKTDAPGSSDKDILLRAADDSRVLITFDTDKAPYFSNSLLFFEYFLLLC